MKRTTKCVLCVLLKVFFLAPTEVFTCRYVTGTVLNGRNFHQRNFRSECPHAPGIASLISL